MVNQFIESEVLSTPGYTSSWEEFERWWIKNKPEEVHDISRKQFEHHPLISASTLINQSCLGVIDIPHMQYLYLSPNFEKFIDSSDKSYLTEGVRWVFQRIHPDDINAVLLFSELINKYLKKLSEQQRIVYRSCWDFRVRHEQGDYFRVLQQDCVLKYDKEEGIKELLFVATRIENVVSSISQHLRMSVGSESLFYKYDHEEKNLKVIEPLSKREIEIAKLIARSRSMKQIAEQLHISFNTVKVHSANMMRKLMVKDSIEMISLLRNWGFI